MCSDAYLLRYMRGITVLECNTSKYYYFIAKKMRENKKTNIDADVYFLLSFSGLIYSETHR